MLTAKEIEKSKKKVWHTNHDILEYQILYHERVLPVVLNTIIK